MTDQSLFTHHSMVRLEVLKEVFLPTAGISEALVDNNIFSILRNMFLYSALESNLTIQLRFVLPEWL